jgi:hypothetical protein
MQLETFGADDNSKLLGREEMVACDEGCTNGNYMYGTKIQELAAPVTL